MTSHPTYGAVPPNNTGSGTVIVSSPDATATFTAGTVTVNPNTHSNVVFTSGTGVSQSPWGPTGTSAGTMHAKDLILDGVSLKQLLEERLNLLVPNPEIEQEWSELKELGDAYRKLEQDLIEKSRMWQALQKTS
jgi:hypothetical protein